METVQPQINENVWVIDKAFFIPQLNRYRRVWLYLPTDYFITRKKYPVLYMHDGQNLFDDATSFSGEWCVDETLSASKEKCILVGIDNGGPTRINEYSISDTEHGKGEGRAYLEFIVNTLKPYIDTMYRTLPQARYTGMAGSSMGGLITFYAGLYHPHVFGILGVLSPSFWIAPQIFDEARHKMAQNNDLAQRYFFYGGGKEGENMIKHVKNMSRVLKGFPSLRVKHIIDPEGTHSESVWREHFPVFYQWMMSGLKTGK